MKLRFYAAADTLVCERHQYGSSMANVVGNPARFVGRTFDPDLLGYPASSDPHECESGTGEALYLIREVKDGALIPADKETAAACGVAFVEHFNDSGVMRPKAGAVVRPKSEAL